MSPPDGRAEDRPGADDASPPAALRRASGGSGGRRRRRVRSLWMWLALGVLGVGLVAWLVLSLPRTQDPATPQPTPSSSTAPTQRTLLIQVRNDADLGADNVVTGADADLPATQVLVPSRLLVDVPGSGQQTLAQTARLIDRTASQDALSDLLALRIDSTLSLTRLALAGMVDYVGGVTVTVDEPITQTDPQTGAETVIVPAGTQRLDGTQAAAYALAWLPDEPESARMARYSAVLTETIRALPDSQVAVEQMLTSLGSSVRTTTSTADVAGVLLGLRSGILAGTQQVHVLPTTDAGSDLTVVRADLAGAQKQLESTLPTALLGDAARPRVVVQDGVGTPGLVAQARDDLVGAGLVFVNGGNADAFGHDTTEVIVAADTAEDRAFGARVAAALDVPVASITVADPGSQVADVAVVLGADFPQ